MKTDSNFKFPKRYKMMLASIKSKEKRDLWKKSFIECVVAEDEHRKSKLVMPKGE